MLRLAARFLVPRAGDIWVNGHVVIAEGRLLAVGQGPPPGRGPVHDLGDAVLLPGLVNAHAHLELTGFRDAVPATGGFPAWARRLIARKRDTGARDFVAAAAAGAAALAAEGTVAVGDVVSVDACVAPVRDSGLRGVCYLETLGFDPEAPAAALAGRLATAEAVASAMAIGLSPHAPYSVAPALLRAALRAAGNRRLAIHVAETRDEMRLFARGDGPLATMLRGLGARDADLPRPGATPLARLDAAGALGPRTCCIHVNYPTPDDVARLARRGASVVFCPRSHAFFGHAPHPVATLRAAGIRVALGTDSLASNDTLSIRDEMAFLAGTHADLAPDEVLDMATRAGAEALGTGPGVLRAGAPADLTAIALGPGGGDPLERVVGGEGTVVLTLAGGRALHDPRRCAV